VIGDSNGQLGIYNSSSSSLSLVNSFYGHWSYIWRIRPSPFNSDYVATCSGDATVKIWYPFNWTLIRTYSQHSSQVFALEWLDNDTIASAGSYDQTIKIWSLSSGQTKTTIKTLKSGYVYSLKFLNNNIHLAAGFSYDINFYNINDGSLVSNLKGHTWDVYEIVQLNIETLASSSGDGTVRIWNLTTNTCKFILTGHTQSVNGLKQITPNILASGSTDSTIKLWDTTSGQLIRTLTGHTGPIYMSVDLLNSQTLVSCDFGSYNGEIKLWNWSTGECLSTIQTNAYYVYSLAVVNSVEGIIIY
jgi:WD40 repeat protein